MVFPVKQLLMKRSFILLLLGFLSLLSIAIGAKNINFMQLSGNDLYILFISRLPRLISILIVGSSMSIAGLIMQTITKNKFVSPSTAGTVEWSRFGVLIAILFFGTASTFVKMSVAFICSLLGSLLFLKLLSKIQFKNSILIPLIGIMLGNVVYAITTFFAYRYDLVQNMTSWLQGNFSLVIRGRYELLYVGIPFLILGYLFANRFTIAGMGRDFSRNLGLNHDQVVAMGLIIVAMITSAVLVSVGSISYLDLIIPNIVSLYKGDNLKNTIFDTALLGATFVLACDILGRVLIFPYEISIGVIVSTIGSGLFLWMILRRTRDAV